MILSLSRMACVVAVFKTQTANIKTSIAALEEEIVKKYFDAEKSKHREYKMLENVKSKLIEGRNVIVTGAGHLTFFKREIRDAQLPFRN